MDAGFCDENERTTDRTLKEGKKPGTGQARDVTYLPAFGTPDSAWSHVVPASFIFIDTDAGREILLQTCQNEAPDRGRDKNYV